MRSNGYNRYQTPTSIYESTYRLRDNEDDFTCRLIIKDFTFDDFHNPRAFNDWLDYLDYYFDWYMILEECKARFARMRLVGSVRIYWTSVEIAQGAISIVLGGAKMQT